MDSINISWNTTSKDYKRWLYIYGIMPLLTILEMCEACENYEECNKIVSSINEHNELVGKKDLPTKYYVGYIEVLSNEIRKDFNSDFDIYSFETYTKMLLKEILDLNTNPAN